MSWSQNILRFRRGGWKSLGMESGVGGGARTGRQPDRLAEKQANLELTLGIVFHLHLATARIGKKEAEGERDRRMRAKESETIKNNKKGMGEGKEKKQGRSRVRGLGGSDSWMEKMVTYQVG